MPKNPAQLAASAVIAITLAVHPNAHGDDLLYRYEGDVPPYDNAAGWVIGQLCSDPCTESTEDGHYVLHWAHPADVVHFKYVIARSPAAPPRTLWVEWHFSSSRPLEANFYTCDGIFDVQYARVSQLVFMYGDAGISFSGDDVIMGLELGRLHTYRFESVNGTDYRITVDGIPFIVATDGTPNTVHSLGLAGGGGCQTPPVETTNEWDFVRYGTISYGEKIVEADPPRGFLRAADFPALDRFTVRFEEPNYVYVDEIGVEVFDADGNPSCLRASVSSCLPAVSQTRRLDNGPPDVVEIVLDKPIPLDSRTVFTFDDGTIRQNVSYTYIQGDANADGRFDLRDAAELQNCFFDEFIKGRCWAFDFDESGYISLEDYGAFHPLLAGTD